MARRLGVIGLGVMGRAVARYLARNGAEVVAVDRDPAAVKQVAAHVSKALVIDSRDREGLLQLGPEQLQGAVVAVGSDVEASVMATLVLSRHLKVPEVFARATTQNHAEILSAVGATTVVPVETEMGRRVAQAILWPQFRDFFAVTGDLALVETAPTPEMIGRTLGELDLRRRYGAHCLALRRGRRSARSVMGGDKIEEVNADRIVNLPDASVVITEDDLLVVVGLKDELARLFASVAASAAAPLDDNALNTLLDR